MGSSVAVREVDAASAVVDLDSSFEIVSVNSSDPLCVALGDALGLYVSVSGERVWLKDKVGSEENEAVTERDVRVGLSVAARSSDGDALVLSVFDKVCGGV